MKRSLIALALASILPISAQAGELNYNYVEAGYINSHFDGEGGDGFSVAGSAAFNENFYGTASYRRVKNSDFGITLDETTLNLGWRHALTEKADFIAEVGYVDVGADIDGLGSDSANGYRVAAGFRGWFAPNFEGNIKAYYTDISDSDWGGSELASASARSTSSTRPGVSLLHTTPPSSLMSRSTPGAWACAPASDH